MAVVFSETLNDGQLVVTVITSARYKASPAAQSLGSELGYWLFRFRKPDQWEVLAKFANQEAAEDFFEGLGQDIVYWAEE